MSTENNDTFDYTNKESVKDKYVSKRKAKKILKQAAEHSPIGAPKWTIQRHLDKKVKGTKSQEAMRKETRPQNEQEDNVQGSLGAAEKSYKY